MRKARCKLELRCAFWRALKQGVCDVLQVGGGSLGPAKLHLGDGQLFAEQLFDSLPHLLVGQHLVLVNLC